MKTLQGRKIFGGQVQGLALVSSMGISFYGGVDPTTGVVVEKGHCLEGISVAGTVLIFPTGKGSTVGSYTLYRLKKAGLAPLAIINRDCEPITAVGCIISEIPCIDQVDINEIGPGMQIELDADAGMIHVLDIQSGQG